MSDVLACTLIWNMVWMHFSVLEMSQESILLCRVLSNFLPFFVCRQICYLCPFEHCLFLDIPDHILYMLLICFSMLRIKFIGISNFLVYWWLSLKCPWSIGLPASLMLMLDLIFSFQLYLHWMLMASRTV